MRLMGFWHFAILVLGASGGESRILRSASSWVKSNDLKGGLKGGGNPKMSVGNLLMEVLSFKFR